MALVVRGITRCMICGQVLQPNDEIGASAAFIAERSDPFWPYSDAAFHRACFDGWEHRDSFEAKYAAAIARMSAMQAEEI